jgi:hypothetical protein
VARPEFHGGKDSRLPGDASFLINRLFGAGGLSPKLTVEEIIQKARPGYERESEADRTIEAGTVVGAAVTQSL